MNYQEQIFQLLDNDPGLTTPELQRLTGCSKSTSRVWYNAYHGIETHSGHTGYAEPEVAVLCDVIQRAVRRWQTRRPCNDENCPWVEEEVRGEVVRYKLHDCAPWAARFLASRTAEDLFDLILDEQYPDMTYKDIMDELGINIPPAHLREE